MVQVTTSIAGLRRSLSLAVKSEPRNGRELGTGLPLLDALAPGGRFVSAAVHEVLSTTDVPAFLLPLLLARAAAAFGRIVWCDFTREFYPPAAAALGLPLERVMVLRPNRPADELWAVAECLRCKGVSGCVAPVGRLSRVQARRIQLAAEAGGGIGLLLRHADAINQPYAAATRWLVRPAAGERMTQRWAAELIHGHGGHVGQRVLLEICRETHHVRAVEAVVHRQGQPAATA